MVESQQFTLKDRMKFATKAIHCGFDSDPTTGALISPIYMTSTYMQEIPGVEREFSYTRANNPNFTFLEKQLAALEEAKYATVFSSGLGTLTALISTLSQGDHIVGLDGVYGGTYRLFRSVFSRFGIEYNTIPNPTPEKLAKALSTKPKWLFFETPTNPLLDVFDIEAMVNTAKRYGVSVIVDNTFATPYFQNPLKYGVDVVWHSTTKYISGHSDVVGGVALTNNEVMHEQMVFGRKAIGLNPSPFDCWLIARGAKTLALRMHQHEKNAIAIASFLEKHPKIKKVYFPGLPSHPSHAIAKKQMSGFGGMISAEFKLSLENTKRLLGSFKLFALAESLGGIESLVSHPATMTHASMPALERKRCGIDDGLVRFSVGIEDAQDLIADITQALDGVAIHSED